MFASPSRRCASASADMRPARGEHGLGRRRAGQDRRELPDGPPVEDGLGNVVRVHRRIAALGKNRA